MLLSLHSNILKLKQIQEFTITMKMKTLHSNIFKLKHEKMNREIKFRILYILIYLN